MPDHFREPTRTMGPRSPGSDHSHPLSLVVKSGDEANNLVHKKKTVENKLGSSRSPQQQQHSTTNPISNSAGNSDTTSGFSSDASGGGENRTSPISICPPANRQSCSNEIEQPQDFSVERFIEDSTSSVNRDRHSFQAERERQNEIDWIDRKHKYELKRDVDDNSPLPLIVSRKRSNDVVEINERSTGYSKNNSGYASPNDDSGHDGEIEDNLDTSGSSSPVLHTAERYLSNSQKSSQKREEFRAKELVIPEVVLERKVDHLISTQGISPPTENESNKRNNIHPNVTIEKVVSKENDPEHGYSSNGDATSNESEKSEEEPKHHIKVKSGIKIKEFARFDTDVVDAAEMERQLLGPNTKYEQTLAALTGLPRRSIIPPTYTIRREGLANDDNARVKCADIENTSKPTVDERHKLVEEDIDIRSEVSSIDTWMSGASCHSYATKHGDNIFYEDHIMRARMSQGNYRCTYCDKMFTNSYHLTSHLVTHTGERSFSCPKCEKSFGRRSTLRAHMTTHSKTSNFMCPVCEKACNDNNSLEEHIRYEIYIIFFIPNTSEHILPTINIL